MLRVAIGGLGFVFLGAAVLGALSLHSDGWRWWVAIFTALALLEAIDFLVAAFRRRGGWPTGANAMLDLLLP